MLLWNIENFTSEGRPGRHNISPERIAYVRHVLWREKIDLALIMETGPDVEKVGQAITWDVEGGGSALSWNDWRTWLKRCADKTWRSSWMDKSWYTSRISSLYHQQRLEGNFYKFHKTAVTGKQTNEKYSGETYLVVYSTSGGKKLESPPSVPGKSEDYRECCKLNYCGVDFGFIHAPSPGHKREKRLEVLDTSVANCGSDDFIFLGDLNFKQSEQVALNDLFSYHGFEHAGPISRGNPTKTSLRITKNQTESNHMSQPYDQVWIRSNEFEIRNCRAIEPNKGEFEQKVQDKELIRMAESLQSEAKDWQPRDGKKRFEEIFEKDALAELYGYVDVIKELCKRMSESNWDRYRAAKDECMESVDDALEKICTELKFVCQRYSQEELSATRFEYVDHKIRQIGAQIDRIASFALRDRDLFQMYRARISDHLPVAFEVHPSDKQDKDR